MNRIAVILKGYPRLSETFIAQEIHALEKAGMKLDLVSLRHPTDTARHPIHAHIHAPVNYLPEYLYQEPVRVLKGVLAGLRRSTFIGVVRIFIKDLLRDPTPNRIRRFGQALVMAREISPSVKFLYAHFLHTPTSVARYCSELTGLPFSCSAHAKDIWTSPDWDLAEKLADCDFTATCTAVNAAHLRSLARHPERVHLVYHGLDFSRFEPAAKRRPGSDGGDESNPVRLVSVGRAVEKKGYADLLRALAALPAGLHWRLRHIGGGPLLDSLRALARERGLESRIQWSGSAPQGEVLAAYRQAEVFVLASKIAHDGDRDGLPNVLMEAQSQALACVATRVSAIPELIRDGETGLLVAPGDPAAMSEALARVIGDPMLRLRLAEAGNRTVRAEFSLAHGIDRLMGLFAAAGQRPE